MKKLFFINILILLIGLFISYNIGFKKAVKTNEQFKKEIEEDVLENNSVPECDFGKCPEYSYFDVDGDGKSESIVLEPIGMSQFGGRVRVIDDGRVVFRSDTKMFVGVKSITENDGDNENGFIIYYSKVPNARSNDDILWDHYKYIDGKYVLEKTTSAGKQ